jgi:hypothetical protein
MTPRYYARIESGTTEELLSAALRPAKEKQENEREKIDSFPSSQANCAKNTVIDQNIGMTGYG